MTIDMSQFQQAFFEESIEGLDVMEAELLRIDRGEQDGETINTIFRAAHSIKGGAGTFGFPNISEFTHVMETLLDEMRDGRREITHPAIQLLLESADVLRSMISEAQGGAEVDLHHVEMQHGKLKALLENKVGAEPDSGKSSSPKKATAKKEAKKAAPKKQEKEAENATSQSTTSEWHIVFKPLPHLLRTGNEPARILRELRALGTLRVEVDVSQVPIFAMMEAEDCFLSWNLYLDGSVAIEKIQEQFDWVMDDCSLVIERTTAAPGSDELVSEAETVKAAGAEEDDVLGEEEESVVLESVVVDDRRVASNSSDRREVADERRAPIDRRTGKLTATEAASIRVGTDKIDALINMVGELVIIQSMLSELGGNFSIDRLERLQDGLGDLARNTREMQESIMRIRMLPISFAFNRLPRMIHDTGNKLGKKIELVISGEQTELDKTVMEKIGDPLVHLARNSIDHGIETPEVRVAKGKPATGTITLNAFHQGGNIMIEIADDGAGLPEEKIRRKAIEKGFLREEDQLTKEQVYDFIFHPGFSTADQISDVSGRGVGMDVVKQNIRALGGSVEVTSEIDKGTKFSIRLPLTLAILDGQLVKVGGQVFIVQLTSIVESLQVERLRVNDIAGSAEMYKVREEYIPVIRLHEAFNVQTEVTDLTKGLLVVVEGDGRKIGLFVDDLLGQQQVVIKSLESNFQKINGVSGATILGDGQVALIIDVAGLIELSRNKPKKDANPHGSSKQTVAA